MKSLILLSLLVFSQPASGKDDLYGDPVRMPIGGTRGIVVADDAQAANWGAEILRKGGNAIDAAIAIAFEMSVTRPQFAALGGGGFLIYCPPRGAECSFVDFREKAPAKASRDMYVRDGKADPKLSQAGALASGIPGNVAGWLLALQKFGHIPRQMVLREPIRDSRAGVRVSTHTERAARGRWNAMNAEARRVFGCGHPDGPCTVGELLKQPDLANVLEKISARGAEGFYEGPVAGKIARGLQSAGGILTESDLRSYAPEIGKPLSGFFHGLQVVTMPPPSSGGAILLQLLGYMDRARNAGLLKEGFASIPALHAEAHALALGFADRTEHLGDPAFFPVPLDRLLSASYLDSRWKTFSPKHAAIPESPGVIGSEPAHTTSLAAIDRDGGAVAMTITVNDNFGSGFVPPGTGVVMNNQMDDFSAQPGVPNLFGLVGGEANSIRPGKRPLSSMTPTLVRDREGKTVIALGAAGGPRIISAVFQVLMNRVEFGMPLVDAMAAPRIHEQWKPEKLRMERNGFAPETRQKMSDLGYQVEESDRVGVSHAAERLPNGRAVGAPDPRGEGASAAE